MFNSGHGQVKSGSNANGNWIRYPDGTQICFKAVTITLASSSTWQSQYVYAVDMGLFPVAFTNTPVVNVTNGGAGVPYMGYIVRIKNITNSNAGSVDIARPDDYTCTFIINMIAIGRWY